ncbi:MAG TPA: hypothetical protein VF553_21880 [Pyrinomonadaceae bacterium]
MIDFQGESRAWAAILCKAAHGATNSSDAGAQRLVEFIKTILCYESEIVST